MSFRKKNESIYYNFALDKINRNQKKVIWIHAASGGEFEQVIPFLEAIDKLGKNEVSRIYQMEYGWAIAVKTDERFIDINFINCEEDLINTKRNTIYDEWLKTLKDSSNIEIFSNKFD